MSTQKHMESGTLFLDQDEGASRWTLRSQSHKFWKKGETGEAVQRYAKQTSPATMTALHGA